jgi:hypothetical protein
VSLALARDVVLAAESAYFLVRFMNIGPVFDGGPSLLARWRWAETRSEYLPTAV